MANVWTYLCMADQFDLTGEMMCEGGAAARVGERGEGWGGGRAGDKTRSRICSRSNCEIFASEKSVK